MQGSRLRQREGSNQGSQTPNYVLFAAMWFTELPIKMPLKLLFMGKEGVREKPGSMHMPY